MDKVLVDKSTQPTDALLQSVLGAPFAYFQEVCNSVICSGCSSSSTRQINTRKQLIVSSSVLWSHRLACTIPQFTDYEEGDLTQRLCALTYTLTPQHKIGSLNDQNPDQGIETQHIRRTNPPAAQLERSESRLGRWPPPRPGWSCRCPANCTSPERWAP